MISVDTYLNRVYSFSAYNCGHFLAEVWKDITGEDISKITVGFFDSSQQSIIEKVPRFRQIRSPQSPCVVLSYRQNARSHAGLFYEDRVLHLSETGVKYEDLSMFCRFSKQTLFYK